MTSGIYLLTFPNKYFYLGKSENIEKRWQQHWKDFEKGTHSKKMQEAFNQYGYPNKEVFIECHPDHCDLYESIAIEHNMNERCLNGNQPRRVPQEEWELLTENGQYAMLSTAEHIKLLESRLKEIEAKDNEKRKLQKRLSKLQDNGLMLPEEITELVEDLNTDLSYLANLNIQRLQELQRLSKLGWFDRLFNFKVTLHGVGV